MLGISEEHIVEHEHTERQTEVPDYDDDEAVTLVYNQTAVLNRHTAVEFTVSRLA